MSHNKFDKNNLYFYASAEQSKIKKTNAMYNIKRNKIFKNIFIEKVNALYNENYKILLKETK